MAALAHAGVGFAAKRVAPSVPLGWLLVGASLIDIVWAVFWFFGLAERIVAYTLKPGNHPVHGISRNSGSLIPCFTV